MFEHISFVQSYIILFISANYFGFFFKKNYLCIR